MSQAGIISTSASVPSNVATTYTTNSGNATPAANVINFLAADTTDNNDNGLITTGTGNTVNHLITNRGTGTVSTTDPTLTTIFTLPLSATPGVYYVYGNIQAFNASTPAGAGYSFTGGFRSTGAAAVELGTEYHDTFQETALLASDIFVTVSGNNILVQVQGVAGLNVNWNALLEYRFVS